MEFSLTPCISHAMGAEQLLRAELHKYLRILSNSSREAFQEEVGEP